MSQNHRILNWCTFTCLFMYTSQFVGLYSIVCKTIHINTCKSCVLQESVEIKIYYSIESTWDGHTTTIYAYIVFIVVSNIYMNLECTLEMCHHWAQPGTTQTDANEIKWASMDKKWRKMSSNALLTISCFGGLCHMVQVFCQKQVVTFFKFKCMAIYSWLPLYQFQYSWT